MSARLPALLFAALTGTTAGRMTAQFAPPANALVSTQWLSQHLHDPELVLLQVGPPSSYSAGHIEGARLVTLAEISAPPAEGALALEMLPATSLRTALEHLGISDRSRVVVVFDSGWVSPATRVLFTLGYAGLGDRAAFLDGGADAWRNDKRPLVTTVSPATSGHVSTTVRPALVVNSDFVAAHRNAAHAHVVDARDAQFFSGPTPSGHMMTMASGHVPGAVNIPFGSMVDSANHLLPRVAIEAKFRAAGIAPGDTVIAYCHVGQQATLLLFGAALAGHPVRLYDGSFEDWSNRKLPTEGGQ
jgi:thiosulfate/3-mercaptopyruvate sulfurtransferase